MTNDLARRVDEHKAGLGDGFSRRYRTTDLLYYECASDVNAVIAREKQLKGWSRDKKNTLIASLNPNFADLSTEML